MSSAISERTGFDTVYIFCGDASYTGVSYESVKCLLDIVRRTFADATLCEWNAQQSLPAQWGHNDLCILPGGECGAWNKLLSQAVQKQMLQWIEQGGKVATICAGAYFCSQISDFKLDQFNRIESIRLISLFPGTCRGPLFSHQAEIVKIRWEKNSQEGYVAIIKGGEFMPADGSEAEYTVLARFTGVPREPIAVVRCQKGKGTAVQSSVHWEFGHKEIKHLQHICPHLRDKLHLLKQSKNFRLQCITHIFSELAPQHRGC